MNPSALRIPRGTAPQPRHPHSRPVAARTPQTPICRPWGAGAAPPRLGAAVARLGALPPGPPCPPLYPPVPHASPRSRLPHPKNVARMRGPSSSPPWGGGPAARRVLEAPQPPAPSPHGPIPPSSPLRPPQPAPSAPRPPEPPGGAARSPAPERGMRQPPGRAGPYLSAARSCAGAPSCRAGGPGVGSERSRCRCRWRSRSARGGAGARLGTAPPAGSSP